MSIMVFSEQLTILYQMWNRLRLPRYFTKAFIEDYCKWCIKLNIQKDTICPSCIGKFVQASYQETWLNIITITINIKYIQKDTICPSKLSGNFTVAINISTRRSAILAKFSSREITFNADVSNNCKIIGSLTGAYWSNAQQRNCHHHY